MSDLEGENRLSVQFEVGGEGKISISNPSVGSVEVSLDPYQLETLGKMILGHTKGSSGWKKTSRDQKLFKKDKKSQLEISMLRADIRRLRAEKLALERKCKDLVAALGELGRTIENLLKSE